jgi:signal transduction histidine kinase
MRTDARTDKPRIAFAPVSKPEEKPFTHLLREELSKRECAAHFREFRAGETIFAAGDVGEGLYVIESGRVQIAATDERTELRPLAIIGPGDFFGEMAVLDDAPRSATATAEADTKAFYLGRDELLQLLKRHPGLALTLIREFSARMRATNKKYLDEIIQSERLAVVGRSAQTIVHDFKNPLIVIGLAAEVAGGASTPPLVRKKARDSISRQVERMTQMLNELIEFARPTGRQPAMSLMDFAPYLSGLITELQADVAERHVTIELANPPPEVEVSIEPNRLARVFYNLVNNAVEAMPVGGKITLHFHVNEGELQVDLSDNGSGIAPDIADVLFEPFATHGKTQGTGLGLSICKRIVEDHGGRLWVRNESGKGATFSFTLPLLK